MNTLTLAQNKLTMLNARLVIAQREGSERDVLELMKQINETQETIKILQGEN
jgi:hypothetical protein